MSFLSLIFVIVFFLHSLTNRLRTDELKQLPQTVPERQTMGTTNDNGDDDIFIKDETNDDHQARMRRQAPTRHSIKSLTGRKILSKQSSTTEVK